MRFRYWITLALVVLFFSSCGSSGKELVFFYDQDFGQMAEFAPDIFSDNKEPLFPWLSKTAEESGYALKLIPVDILQENYTAVLQNKLPKNSKQIIVTSFLYNVPEIRSLIPTYQAAVVGATLDIDLDGLNIIGNGFSLLQDEGRTIAAIGKKINFIALKSGFQQRITQAFSEGAGDLVSLFEAELDANSIVMPQSDNLIVASYGKCFKSFSSPQHRTGTIRVVNFPSSPEYVDPYMKKRVEAYICYDFATSFKSAILELASGRSGGKNFYSFDLVRR